MSHYAKELKLPQVIERMVSRSQDAPAAFISCHGHPVLMKAPEDFFCELQFSPYGIPGIGPSRRVFYSGRFSDVPL
jgi:hypothetical protein